MATILEQLRKEWSSFLKWTVTLSVFFITASLTIVVFQIEVFERKIDAFNLWSVGVTVLFSLLTIMIAWILLALHVYRILKLEAGQPDPRNEIEWQNYWSENLDRFNFALQVAKPLDVTMLIFFILSFFTFIIHFISYLA